MLRDLILFVIVAVTVGVSGYSCHNRFDQSGYLQIRLCTLTAFDPAHQMRDL